MTIYNNLSNLISNDKPEVEKAFISLENGTVEDGNTVSLPIKDYIQYKSRSKYGIWKILFLVIITLVVGLYLFDHFYLKVLIMNKLDAFNNLVSEMNSKYSKNFKRIDTEFDTIDHSFDNIDIIMKKPFKTKSSEQ